MKPFLLFILLVINQRASSQMRLNTISNTDSSKSILYLGVENYLVIARSGITESYEQLMIDESQGTVQKVAPHQYLVRVYRPGVFQIKVGNSKSGAVIGTQQFDVVSVEYLKGSFIGRYDTTISKAALLRNPFMSPIYPRSYLRHNFRIESFSFRISSDPEETIRTNESNMFSQENLDFLKKLNPGDIIFFENIRTNCPNGRPLKLDPFWLKIQ